MQGFDEEVYGRIAALLPPERLSMHLASFEQNLRDCLSEPSDREGLKSSAHKLVSQAGMLGFTDLSEKFRDLEEACESGASIDAPLAEAREAADLAKPKLTELQSRVAST